jgi:hypothetical protein
MEVVMRRYRAAVCAVVLLVVGAPAGAQVDRGPTDLPRRYSIEFGLGSHVSDGGDAQLVSFGYRPHRDMTVLVNAARDYVPTQVEHYPDGYSATRGGMLAFVSGEFRYTVPIGARVSPYGFAGTGLGIQRPNVNEFFPFRAGTSGVHVFYLGGGARVRLHSRLDLLVDGRLMLHAGLESDGFGALLPVRAGLSWRF